MKPGDQIAYGPHHAWTGKHTLDLAHPDVEFGFVMSHYGADGVFCRYWRKGSPGKLRTVANSERTPVDLLIKHKSVPDKVIQDTIRMIKNEPEKYGFVRI